MIEAVDFQINRSKLNRFLNTYVVTKRKSESDSVGILTFFYYLNFVETQMLLKKAFRSVKFLFNLLLMLIDSQFPRYRINENILLEVYLYSYSISVS